MPGWGRTRAFKSGCIDTYGWGHQTLLSFVRNCFPEQAASTLRVQGGPRGVLLQRPPSLHFQGPWWLSEEWALAQPGPYPAS